MARIIPHTSDITMNKYGVIQPIIRKISDWLKKYSSLCNLQGTRLRKIKHKMKGKHIPYKKAKSKTKYSFTFYEFSGQCTMKTGLQLTVS